LRVALLYLGLTIGYVFIVFAIFYIVWTPLDADRVQGVQGRYFLVLLRVIAVATAAVLAGGLSATIRAAVSLGAVILSGLALRPCCAWIGTSGESRRISNRPATFGMRASTPRFLCVGPTEFIPAKIDLIPCRRP